MNNRKQAFIQAVLSHSNKLGGVFNRNGFWIGLHDRVSENSFKWDRGRGKTGKSRHFHSSPVSPSYPTHITSLPHPHPYPTCINLFLHFRSSPVSPLNHQQQPPLATTAANDHRQQPPPTTTTANNRHRQQPPPPPPPITIASNHHCHHYHHR